MKAADVKTVLEIIRASWAKAGNRGPLTGEFITAWRAKYPTYGKWPLWTLFKSGSGVPMRGKTTDERACDAWIAAGHPRPGAPDFDIIAFDAYLATYRDEFSDEYYQQ